MATIAIFGGTGYAGGAIRAEALRRGHTVISISRKEAEVAGTGGLISRAGSLYDPALVDHMAVEADVNLSPAGGFGSYAPGGATGHYRTGGDVLLADAEGNSHISGADYAKAFVDEIEQPQHRGQRFTVAY